MSGAAGVGGASLTRALGRIAIGLGLILLALHILIDTLAPAEQAPLARALLASITGDPILCIALAAVLTWAAHSSVAVVLLVMSLAFSHFVSAEAALAMVLGANLGSAINPLIEGGIGGNPASRRLPLGNLINRLVGVLVVLPFLPALARELPAWQPDASKMTAEFHMLFNIALALIFIGPLDAMAWLLVRILPDRPAPADPAAPRYLDESILETPPVALANAARETLRMGDAVETMLREKAELRTAELAAADRHFERLREGRPESLETTSLHLDVLSDLKCIHSHICSVAYPVLEAAGDLPAREAPPARPPPTGSPISRDCRNGRSLRTEPIGAVWFFVS